MGGVMSFFMALTYPDVFGYALIFSPAMQVYADQTTETFISSFNFMSSPIWPRLYIYAGGSGGESTLTPYVAIIHDAFIDNGYGESSLSTLTDLTQGHNESAWATYFPIAYSWLVIL